MHHGWLMLTVKYRARLMLTVKDRARFDVDS